MRKNRMDDFSLHSLSPITKICSYCSEQKQLYEIPLKISRETQNQSSGTDKEQRRRKYVNSSLDEESDRDALFRSNAIIRNFEKRKQCKDLPSPTSCLKSLGNSRKSNNGLEKRVNFRDDKYSRESEDQGNDYSPALSNSSSYYELPQYELLKGQNTSRKDQKLSEDAHRKQKMWERNLLTSIEVDTYPRKNPENKRSTSVKSRDKSNGKFTMYETKPSSKIRKNPSTETPPVAKSASIRSGSDSTSKRRESANAVCKHGRVKSPKPTTKGRSSDSSAGPQTVDEDLNEVFHRMSLNSSAPCSSRVSIENSQKPRVVKARDGLKRAALKRMHIYPPEGQQGTPLTLLKTWSNIDCQVRGSAGKGFRYKVYYIQKFESDKWFPNEKTGNPFRRKEDTDYSTDYG